MTESKRQQKFSKLIQKDLGDIFQRDKMGVFSQTFVTIAEVKITPDLSLARVYVSIFSPNKRDVFDNIIEHKSEIRRELGFKIGKQVRIVPDLEFFLDEVEDRAARIDKIISDLDIPPADENSAD